MDAINSLPDYNYLTHKLDTIYSDYIRLNEDEVLKNTEIVITIVTILMDVMKNVNKDFANMKPLVQLAGSVYDKLKIKNPNEFDMLLVLTLPLNREEMRTVQLDSKRNLPGYTSIHSSVNVPKISGKNGRLSAKNLREWMQGILDKSLYSVQYGKHKGRIKKGITISHTAAGPAYTLIVTAEYLSEPIHVDLVPCFVMSTDKRPANSSVDFSKVNKVHNQYFLVPKPTDNEYNWRIAFTIQEKSYMDGKYNLRKVLRLLKLLRDTQRLDGLTSYYIKTIFLWEIEKRNNEAYFWTAPTGNLLMHMLKVLRDNLKSGTIKTFWCPNSNLLLSKKLNRVTIDQWSNRLTRIIDDIDRNGRSNNEIIDYYFIGNTRDQDIPNSDNDSGSSWSCSIM